MSILQWFSDFAYLNLLFICFTLKGFVIFGFFPAVYAVIMVSNRLFREKGFGLTNSFKEAYKKHFKKTSVVGYIFLGILAVIISNVFYWGQIDLEIAGVVALIWRVLLILVAVAGLILFPIFVENKFTIKEAVKVSLYLLSQIHIIVLCIIGLYVLLLGFYYFTGAGLFFIFSLPLTWVMFCHYLFINKIEKVKEKLEKKGV